MVRSVHVFAVTPLESTGSLPRGNETARAKASARYWGHGTFMGERASSLDVYRSSLAGIRPLDFDAERSLALAWRAGDDHAGDALVSASLPFVIRVANEYRRWGVPMEDLIQQGNLGLLKAAQKFEPARDCRLITYAVYWIRAEIRDYVMRSYRMVRLGTTRTERAAVRAYRRAGADDAAEWIAASGMPAARAERLLPLLRQQDVALDAPVAVDSSSSFGDRLEGGLASPEDEASNAESTSFVRAVLDDALAVLSERERFIIDARILSDEPQTLEQLGNTLGVSKERVRQIEERAREKLKLYLRKHGVSNDTTADPVHGWAISA